MSREGEDHFSVDGTLIKAGASTKSFQPKVPDNHPGDDDPGGPSGPSNTPTSDSTPPSETPPMTRPTYRSRSD